VPVSIQDTLGDRIESGPVRAKICGLRRPLEVEAAARGGAAYVGFVFYPPSPRAVTAAEARPLALATPPGLAKVGLFVDPGDVLLDAVTALVPLDMIQLHGREAPQRVVEVRRRTGLPVMKAVGLREPDDLAKLPAYEGVADQILVDAKPPRGAALPGGNGVGFDHALIAGRRWSRPWMLAGGLTPENLAEAVRLTGARQVDVSSGVETEPGVKDPSRIAAFLDALNDEVPARRPV
jgi:phosphoribosylanthranilate isomerase